MATARPSGVAHPSAVAHRSAVGRSSDAAPPPRASAARPATLVLALLVAFSIVGGATYALGKKARRVEAPIAQPVDGSWMVPTVPRTPTPGTFPMADASPSRAKDASPLPADGSLTVGGYVIEGILGKGGMGTTYAARRVRDGLPAAVKVPHARVLEDPEFGERFLREASLGTTLHHPNIIRIYEAGETHGRPFFAMERLSGETLEARLKGGALPPVQALEIARGIALALDYAHLKGIVHRDLKPANVMILPDGGVKVMDYGIARVVGGPQLTGTLVFLGTPLYCAPEVARGDHVDQQADLYSLGIVLYRMLAGRLPFEAPSAYEVFSMHCNMPLPPMPKEHEVPEDVWGLLLKLTAKSKEERYATAEAFLRDVNGVLNRL
jgi:serine/threonine protein kinase